MIGRPIISHRLTESRHAKKNFYTTTYCGLCRCFASQSTKQSRRTRGGFRPVRRKKETDEGRGPPGPEKVTAAPVGRLLLIKNPKQGLTSVPEPFYIRNY